MNKSTRAATPKGYLAPSEAAERLFSAMWRNVESPQFIKEIKQNYPALRGHLRFGAQMDHARKAIWEAAKRGDIPLWICGKSKEDFVQVPVAEVERLLPVHQTSHMRSDHLHSEVSPLNEN